MYPFLKRTTMSGCYCSLKCSCKITQDVAQTLLDEGIPFRDEDDDPFPRKIYNVFEGIPYEAVPTEAGRSYHGYPWRGRMPRKILNEAARSPGESGPVLLGILDGTANRLGRSSCCRTSEMSCDGAWLCSLGWSPSRLYV